MATLINTAINSYSSTQLEKFESVFRYSVVTTLIDEADPAILNNITTVKISKTFKPTLNDALKYTISFSNALYNPHSGHLASTTGTTLPVVFYPRQDLLLQVMRILIM